MAVLSTACQPSFGRNDADYVRTYMQMQSGIGTVKTVEDDTISYNAFGDGSTVFVFDLTADLSNAEHSEPTNCGSLRAKVCFGDQLPQAIICFVHAEYDNCIEVHQNRNISLDYLI